MAIIVQKWAADFFDIKQLESGRIESTETRQQTYQLYLCHLQRGTSVLLGGPNRCFEGFVSSRNRIIINFDRFQDSVLFLRQFARRKMDDVVESSEQN